MDDWPKWQWNEIQQVGTDYTDVAEVERYDRRMRQFRDVAAESSAILADLNLPDAAASVLEIGTGTGHFARAAASAGCRVTAVDVSDTMLAYAGNCAQAEGVTIDFRKAGFLTFVCPPASLDAVVSVAVLHHLPDLWKAVALQRVYRALKPGGRFVLRDVVFSWQGDDHASAFNGFVNALPAGMSKEAIRHVAQEYSTIDWIMQGLLERAGFNILRIDPSQASLVHYLCEKPA